MVHIKKINDYHFGLACDLSDKDTDGLIRLFKTPQSAAHGVLSGRGSISKTTLDKTGSVVIKYFRRGGLIRHFTRQRYLKLGETRPQLEFEMLEEMKKIGVSAPSPVAWAYKKEGFFFYTGWLVMQEIKKQQSLAEVSKKDSERAKYILKKTAAQLSILIKNKILHVDLHPGNVLVDPTDHVYLIDFDKAKKSRMENNRLKLFYLERWKRAVKKHNLPNSLSTYMEEELLKTTESD